MRSRKLEGASGLGGARGLTTGRVGAKSGPIAPKWVKLKRMARQAKKAGQGKVSSDLYGAYAAEKLNSPTIGTEAYRKAEGAMQGQADQWATRKQDLMGMYYDYMQDKMKRDRDRWARDDDADANDGFGGAVEMHNYRRR